MKRGEQKRIDRKHRFPLRIDEAIHSEVDALAFHHNVSLNVLYAEAVHWAMTSPVFRSHMQEKFPRDERRGHFVYIQDARTQRLGKHP